MKKQLFYRMMFLGIGLITISCSKSNENEEEPIINMNKEMVLINNGNGAVMTISDTDDSEPLSIVQTIPSFSNTPSLTNTKATSARKEQSNHNVSTRAVNNDVFPANLPIMFFFNDKILLNTVKDNFVITVDGTPVNGTIVINAAANGYAILTFTPWQEFKVNNNISVTVKKGMQDDGGNAMEEDISISYKTDNISNGVLDNNMNFEKGNEGVRGIGDASIRSGSTNSLTPQEGNRFAAISSGDQLVSGGHSIGNASSMIILGPVSKDISSLTFWYNFISAEFNDYVDSEYDDCTMVTVSGPKGAYSAFITSVNIVRYENKEFIYPGMPDDGDGYAGYTGWVQKTITFPNVGTPAYITFTVTDVSDDILSSILAIDNLSYN